jgi:hypothetical protein
LEQFRVSYWVRTVGLAVLLAVAVEVLPANGVASGGGTGRIVFSALRGNAQWIDSIGLDGSGLRHIVSGARDPAVSPDGKEIAFTGALDVGVVDASGRDRRRLVGGNAGDWAMGPVWSPDGAKIAFTRSGGAVSNGVWTMNADGSGKRFLLSAPVGGYVPTAVAWFRQGIVIPARVGFVVISPIDGRVRDWIRTPTRAYAAPPVISPNGRQLAYDECDGASSCSGVSVAVMDLQTGRLSRRIPGAATEAWTPSGDLLYSNSGGRIMIQPAHGGRARAITPPTLNADEPAWLGPRKR